MMIWVFIRKRYVEKEAFLSYLFLLCSIVYSLLIVHFGSPGVVIQRHVLWTNITFNIAQIFSVFLIIGSYIDMKKQTKHNEIESSNGGD